HARVVKGLEAALIGRDLFGVRTLDRDQERRHEQREADHASQADEYDDGQIVAQETGHLLACAEKPAGRLAWQVARDAREPAPCVRAPAYPSGHLDSRGICRFAPPVGMGRRPARPAAKRGLPKEAPSQAEGSSTLPL